MIHMHNFPLKIIIFGTEVTLYKSRLTFLKNWCDRNIILLAELLSLQGHQMTFSEFISHLNFPISTEDYVPNGSVALYRRLPCLMDISLQHPIDI